MSVPDYGCPRLVRQGKYARAFCNRRPVGKDGLCKRHRYLERRRRR